jgi:hypothetical protein
MFFLKPKLDTSITLLTFFTYVERQLRKKINRIRRDNDGEYMRNELKYFFLTSGVIYELTAPNSLESNGIKEHLNLTGNMIARSMTIAAPNFLCL